MELITVDDYYPTQIDDLNELPKENNSDCDDQLAQLIFFKIDRYAITVSISLHNALIETGGSLPYRILCFEEEISTNLASDRDHIINLLNNTQDLFQPPNEEYKKGHSAKMFPIEGLGNGKRQKICFNPYVKALYISEMYYKVYNSKDIRNWCDSGQMKFESIKKIIQIIQDKYSYRFVEFLDITFDVLSEIYRIDNNEDRIELLERFFGTSGTALTGSYVKWSNDFFFNDLMPSIKSLLGRLHYS